MKTLIFFVICCFAFCCKVHAEQINLSVGSLSTVQDSLFGTEFQGSFPLPTQIDSLTKVSFAQFSLVSGVVLADSNTTYLTELVALNSDGSLNEDFVSTNILTLQRNGKTYFDITELVNAWKSGILQNNGFMIRRKHPLPTEPDPVFIPFFTDITCKVRMIIVD